jgi:hypothetical protein
MSIIHLIVFLLLFFFFVPVFFWMYKKSPKGSKNKKIFLLIALVSICYASINTYFHRFLIAVTSTTFRVIGRKVRKLLKRDFSALKIPLNYMIFFMVGIVCI